MESVQVKNTEMFCRLQSKETEEMALGFIIGYDKKCQDEFFLELTEDDFSVYEYQVLFGMMRDMYQKQEEITLPTIIRERRSCGYTKPSTDDICSFVQKATNKSFVKGTIQVLKKCTLNRAFVSTMQQVNNKWQGGTDTEEICNELLKNVGNILLRTKTEELISFSQVSDEIERMIKKNIEKGVVEGILETGMTDFDDELGGFSSGDLCVIGAESGAGKSALGLTLATIFGKNGISGAYYSAEMEAIQLASRIYSAEINDKTIYSSTLRKQVLNTNQYELFLMQKEKIGKMPLFFDENNNVDIDAIVKSIRVMKKRFNIQYAVVDYLQMLSANEKNQKLINNELFLGLSARKLKNVAKEEKIVVFLLSQLSRDVNGVGLHASRLRGSGQIMETATQVILMERGADNKEGGVDNEEEPHFKEEGFTDVSSKNRALLHIVKNREGCSGGYVKLGYDAPHTRFYSEKVEEKKEKWQQTEIVTNVQSYNNLSNQMFENQTNIAQRDRYFFGDNVEF